MFSLQEFFFCSVLVQGIFFSVDTLCTNFFCCCCFPEKKSNSDFFFLGQIGLKDKTQKIRSIFFSNDRL